MSKVVKYLIAGICGAVIFAVFIVNDKKTFEVVIKLFKPEWLETRDVM